MASSKTVANAITRAQNELKGITLSSTDSLDFANEVYQIMGNSSLYDWRLAAGTTFGTTAGTQDYANVPTNFSGLQRAYIQDDSSSTNVILPLSIFESLPKSALRGKPSAISQENSIFRLNPVPNVTRTGSGQWAILFSYWKRPKRLTVTGDTFEFDDAWFDTFCKGVTARTASFVDDSRAGTWGGRNDFGKFVGTGMWSEFAAGLNMMIEQEGLASGSSVYAPYESLLKG